MINTLAPVVALERTGARNIRMTLSIDAWMPVFQGHFDGRPRLSGVAQIDRAARFARTHMGSEGVFAGMREIKFLQVIQPLATVSLALDRRDEAVLRLSHPAPATGQFYSRGRLCFV